MLKEKSWLTDEGRARLKVVREALAAGENPYSKTENRDQGGLDRDRAVRRAEAALVRAERSEQQVQELEQKWQSGEGPELEWEKRQKHRIKGFSLFTAEDRKPRDLDKLFCAFCQVEVSHNTVTVGKRTVRHTEFESVTVNGITTIEERIYYRAIRTMACPDCCLKVGSIEFSPDLEEQ